MVWNKKCKNKKTGKVEGSKRPSALWRLSGRRCRLGATGEIGFPVTEKRLHVHGLPATSLHLLGLDPAKLVCFPSPRALRDQRGRDLLPHHIGVGTLKALGHTSRRPDGRGSYPLALISRDSCSGNPG